MHQIFQLMFQMNVIVVKIKLVVAFYGTAYMSRSIHCAGENYVNSDYYFRCIVLMQGLQLRWSLKLTVLVLLCIHMMTSQGHICVQCVTNGLQGKDISMCTKEYTVEKSRLYVQCVTSGLHAVTV